MKINWMKAIFGPEREKEEISDQFKPLEKIQRPAPPRARTGTSPASREQKRQKRARMITRKNQ